MISSGPKLYQTLHNLKKVDLTHTFSPGCPTWTGEIGLITKLTTDLKLDDKNRLKIYHFEMVQNIGTHIDAPSHFIDNGITACQIDLNQLTNLPLCIINITKQGQEDSDYELSIEDIKTYEEKYDKIPPNSLVVCYSGWERHWSDSAKYKGSNGKDSEVHFPAFSLEAVEYLDQNRAICGIGIDTLSPETRSPYPIHSYILGKGKYIVENLANLSKMPESGGVISILPMKAAELSEAPCRVVGMYLE